MSNKKRIKVKKDKKENLDEVTVMVRETLKGMGRNVSPAQEKMLVDFYKFFMMSILATLIDYVLFLILYKAFRVRPFIANSSYIIAGVYHYFMRYKLVIQYKKKGHIEFVLYLLFGLLLSEGALLLAKSHFVGVKLLATLITFIIKKIYFKIKSHPKK